MFISVPVSRPSPALARGIDAFFDDALQTFFAAPRADAPTRTRTPSLDVAESDSAYTVKLDLPGVAKDDVRVDVEGRRVTVQAQVAQAADGAGTQRVLYRERSQTSWARSFTLPQEVQQSDAVAKLEDGVLTLTLPKRAPARIAVN